jgi:hypothetical protein
MFSDLFSQDNEVTAIHVAAISVFVLFCWCFISRFDVLDFGFDCVRFAGMLFFDVVDFLIDSPGLAFAILVIVPVFLSIADRFI